LTDLKRGDALRDNPKPGTDRNRILVLRTLSEMPDAVALIARALGLEVVEASGLAEAEGVCRKRKPGIVLLPARIGGQPALPFMQLCLERAPETQVIMLVERDQINEAAEAMRVGILDCLFLPFPTERLAKTLAAAMGRLGLEVEQAELKRICESASPAPAPPAAAPEPEPQTLAKPDPDSDCVQGNATLTVALKGAIEAAARNRLPVALLGEAGSGKSHCAALIHAQSDDSGSPLIKLDCAALTPQTLPQDIADPNIRATYFFDELTDLSASVQARLVRLIGDEGMPQARLISATTHEPIKAINAGTLRRDLYYRLCVTEIRVPSLRERGDDILLIAQAKLRHFSSLEGAALRDFSPEAAALLVNFTWPGNIRQLVNVCRNLVLTYGITGATLVEADMLPPEIIAARRNGDGELSSMRGDNFLAAFFRGQSLSHIERVIIEAIIRDHGGSVTRAARMLQVAPSTLYRKREQWQRADKDQSNR